MRKIYLLFILNLFISGFAFSQIPLKAFPLSNSMGELWYKGKTDKAVDNSLELYSIYEDFFTENIHDILAQQLKKDTAQNGLKYLEELIKQNNKEINEIVHPIYLWSRSMATNDKEELASIKEELKNIQKENNNYSSRLERYALLILMELKKKNFVDKEFQYEIVNKNIQRLENYENLDLPIINLEEADKRAWYRYLLATNYDYLFSNILDNEEYLKKASEYSPDLFDRNNRNAYFYDALLFTGNSKQFGFKIKYRDYLIKNNREIEALDLLSEITFADPSDQNINMLKEQFQEINKDSSFYNFWENFIHEKGKPTPEVKISFENETLTLPHDTGEWIYIYIWGTWCGPCREELPKLQSFYLTNQQSQSSNLKVYTFSYLSKNLLGFMDKNEYTFPVSEIDKKTSELFDVKGYPTKILITPKGNFLTIPFGADWKTYVKNYTSL